MLVTLIIIIFLYKFAFCGRCFHGQEKRDVCGGHLHTGPVIHVVDGTELASRQTDTVIGSR